MKNLNFYSLDASNNQILRMIVNEIGNVGIGTSVASKKLEVTGDISFNGDLYQNGELFTGGSTIDETTDVSLNNLVIHGDLSANDASFNVIDVNTILIDGRDLISGAPEALDTLNELAAALDNSANFATNVTTTLSSIQSQLSTKQDSISTNDLSLGDINGLYLQLNSKQNTITNDDLTIAFTSGLQTALDSKHPLINETTDVSLNNLVIHGDLSANDASFNVIDVNTILIDGRDLISGAPEALDTLNELAAALDNSANFATNVTTTLSSIQSQLSTKQDSISTNDLSLGDINGLYLQLNSKQNTITNDDLTIAFTSGLQTALDSKHPLINETTDVSLNNLVIHGDLSANDASFNVIDASSINTTSTSYMNSIIPSANNLYSLGDASNVWKDVYIGPGSLYIDGQKVLESDADTIVVGADENQNLKVNTHGSGVLQMESASGIQITTTGSGNIELGSTGSGIVRITDNLALNGNIEIYNDSTNEIKINDNLNVTGDYLQNGTNINTIYATLASPSLTGTPIAPTATSGTNTTQIATTAFVSTAVSNLVNGAPGALDTLSELASALDNSGNFATNVTNTLGSLQTQIDAKQPTISSSARLNANLIHDGTISNTEYGYLNGVTSAIQTQLDTKITASSTNTLTNKTLTSPIISSISNTGTLTLPTSTGTIALTSDIPTQITNNNQLINGAGYITASSSITHTNLIVGGTTYQSATAPTNGMLVEGNVGIGTNNPGSYKLNVNGNTKLQQTYVSKIVHHQHSGTGIWFDTADTLRFIINNKQRMIFDDNGRLGIGDNMGHTPICMLDISCNLNTTGINVKGAGIESNGKFQFILRAEGPDDSTQRVVHFLNSSTRTDDGGANTYTIRNDYGNLRLGNASYDTIINGNVGIGTTDPKAKLNVEDGGFLVGGIDNVTQQGCHIQWNRSGQHGETHIINNIGGATNNGVSSGIKFAMTDSNGTVSDKMFIRNDGNVGIGTTNPLSLLTVGSHTLTNGTRDLIRLNSYRHNEAFTIRNNDDANTGRLEFFWGNTNNNTAQHDNTIDASILTMIHTGNVGIGTTDPKGADLMVNGYIKVVNGISFRNESNYDGTSINCSIHQRGHSVGDGIQFNGYSGLVFTTNNGVERMRITRVDGIGIGTTTPQYALDVHHDGATGFYSTYWNDTSTVSGNDDGTVFSTQSDSQFSNAAANYGQGRISDINSNFSYKISLHAQYGIYCSGGGFMTSSDRRIKKNIVDVSDNVALEMVKNIPCKYYTHIDERLKGSGKTIGFIAQEVAEVMPIAVKLKKEFIPSEMRVLENLSWDTNNHVVTDISDCSGVKYKFFVSNDISNNPAKEVEIIGNADNTFTFDASYINVFCYGKEVDDFHALDKNKLFALNFSATQELIRKVESHQHEIESLKMFNTESNNTLNNLIQENQQIKQENQELKQQIQYIMQHLGL